MKKFLLKLFLLLLLIGVIISSILCLIGYSYYSKALKEEALLVRVSNVMEKEHYLSFDKLPKDYVNAVIATEDKRFYQHGPVDFIAIARAIFTNIKNGQLDEGGSTITQQVAKNIIFNQDNSWVRKVGEIFASHDLEKNYNKNDILALYANSSYFGDGYYCIYDASMGYYNKEPKDLTLGECAMLAGVPNAPSVYAPTVNPDLASKRQSVVLDRMVEAGYISKEDAINNKL